MSKVHISLVYVSAYSHGGKPVDCPSSKFLSDETNVPEVQTSSASAVQYTLTASSDITRKEGTAFWRIANMGTDDVYAVFGTDPDPASAAAAAAEGFGIPAGAVEYFSVGFPNQKVAIINA